MSTSCLESLLIDHIFLPKTLPCSDTKIQETESGLAELFSNFLEKFDISDENYNCTFSVQLDHIKKLFRDCSYVLGNGKPPDLANQTFRVSELLGKLEPGNAFAFYVREQNATILVRFVKNEDPKSEEVSSGGSLTRLMFASFAVSQSNQTVMAHNGDLVAEFPGVCFDIPMSDLIKSKAFAKELITFSNTKQSSAMKKTMKAGQSFDEDRHVAHPLLITQYLASTLTDENSGTVPVNVFTRIRKKIRDEVRFGSYDTPFRRSGLWTSMKVVLQLELVNRFGEQTGRVIYKLMLLRFVGMLCEKLCKPNLSWDTRQQMIAKLARRLAKVELLVQNFATGDEVEKDVLEHFFSEILGGIESTVNKISKLMDSEWKRLAEQETRTLSFNLPRDEDGTIHKLGNLLAYLKTSDSVTGANGKIATPDPRQRHRKDNNEQIFPISFFDTAASNEELHNLVLYDFEKWVLKVSESNFVTSANVSDVFQLLEKYIQNAKTFYHKDPLGGSRMVITCLTILQLFDILATEKYPLLEQHDSGVNPEAIKDLLLPLKRDLEHGKRLEDYFRNRNKKAKAAHSSLVGEVELSTNSFSARYARDNSQMHDLKCKILEYGERKCEEKRQEVRKVKDKCTKLREEKLGLSCTYETDPWDPDKVRHSPCCRNCDLEKQINNCTLLIYEKPLPELEFQRDGVTFELLIPVEIAVLRDALYLYSKEICSCVLMTKENSGLASWFDYSQIRSYRGPRYHKYVNLGSTTKLIMETHYDQRPLHVDNGEDEFIKNNGYNCRFGVGQSVLTCSKDFKIKRWSTFSVEPGSVYENLEWAILSCSHTQNKVLAEQTTCNLNLSLAEFKEFCSLRCGHRLQIRNIYRSLHHSMLSLKEPSVASIICQSLWEAGPPSREGTEDWLRDSHRDFEDTIFTLEMLKLLELLVEKGQKNWNEHYTLLVVIVICNRIFSVSTDMGVKDKAVQLLSRCRQVSLEWAEAVEELLQKPNSNSNNNATDEQQKLRIKLVEISAFGALTFVADDDDSLLQLVPGSEELAVWLQCITRINDNIVLSRTSFGNLKVFTRNLLRWVRCVGVDMERYFHVHLQKGKALGHFVKKQWGAAPNELLFDWTRNPAPSDQWYCFNYSPADKSTTVLQMDVVLGKFLVNGSPVGRLSESITQHPEFGRLFHGFVFTVQPGNLPGQYVTSQRFHECAYQFQIKMDQLIVTETNKQLHQTSELIPHAKINGDIPYLLIHEYSHWLNKTENAVEFRSKEFFNPKLKQEIKYRLDLNTGILIDTATRKPLVDINSKPYKTISRVMALLEHQNYIHVFQDETENCLEGTHERWFNIELPRMGLHFYTTNVLDQAKPKIKSKEYRDYCVSKNQYIGSLIGLQRGLLMNTDWSNSILLLPHGIPTVTGFGVLKDGQTKQLQHQQVLIDNAIPRVPMFLAVEIDSRLHRLKPQPSQSAWLYLAHLHALTASPLADPFTGLTGTEAAIQLLQSPLCWTCEPMDEEALCTLDRIARISPVRTFYPANLHEMEIVKFFEGIPSLASHDAFAFLVKKLRSDSRRSEFAYTSKKAKDREKGDDSISAASLRSYWRHRGTYSPQAHISPEFERTFREEPVCKSVSSLDLMSFTINTDFNDGRIKSARLMAELCKSWLLPSNLRPTLLSQSVCNAGCVLGPPSRPGSQFQQGYNSWSSTFVTNSWLGLYEYARQVKAKGWRSEWTLMLCALVYSSTEFGDPGILTEHMKLLQTIASFPDHFKYIDPPSFSSYESTAENFYSSSKMTSIINSHATSFNCEKRYGERSSDYSVRYDRERVAHYTAVDTQREKLVSYLNNRGLVDSCDLMSLGYFSHFNIANANREMQAALNKWYRNYKLKLFVEQVEAKLKELSDDCTLHSMKFNPLGTPEDKDALQEFGHRSKFNAAEIWYQKMNLELPELDRMLREAYQNPFAKLLEFSNALTVQTTQNERCEFPLQDHLENILVNDSTGIREILTEYSQDLRQSWKFHFENVIEADSAGQNLAKPESEPMLKLLRKTTVSKVNILWQQILTRMQMQGNEPTLNALIDAGLFTRITPTLVLPQLLDENINQHLRTGIQRLALLICEEQKANRCLRFLKMGPSMELALQKELAATGPEAAGWNPIERPEWLLLQIEMDLTIRSVQVDVAEKMAISTGPHSLMQLNMGEGKTSVIIPMLVTRLADGKQLTRVTVLKSLYNTNKKLLTFTIGGLLNQRVYTFPCRRDMKFDVNIANSIQDLYQECMMKKGVVITAPEYRLSFQLKAYDKCRSQDYQLGSQLVHTNNWLRTHVRDVLDECDEILNVKYQLIYTIGEQQAVSGGHLRWEICQKLLKILPKHLEFFQNRDENDNMEPQIQMEYWNDEDEGLNGFPLCRILKPVCYQDLCDDLADDILKSKSKVGFGLPEFRQAERDLLFKFITMPTLQKEDHEAAMSIFETKEGEEGDDNGEDDDKEYIATITSTSSSHLETVLILRGLLACGVILHGLTRRWRVNYGVNPTTGSKKMAVPFRAKDVASERTEFGHTDVAILLTQLSYYYSGLNEQQVLDCFKYLQKYEDKDRIYGDWIRSMSSPVDPTLSELNGVNLADYNQTRLNTVPTLQKNVNVIDFWLGNAVYPRESKSFPMKMMCSPWDLCSDEMERPVTGFSGTNDTRLLLPLTIKQKDLPQLMGTNGKVLYNILLPENNVYRIFQTGISGREMLEKLVVDGIPLLLDVGALMIDLSNEKVAEVWLGLLGNQPECKYDAAVYFNNSDELAVRDHKGRVTSFQLSPYRTNLDRCVIYLDDSHTRGTDLKIARGTRGCVTLGKGVTKDKLVQGCMRMRMLGNGHQIAFYASQEVDNELRALNPNLSANQLGAKEVIIWSLYNSCSVTRDGFQHWTNSASNFYTKKAAHALFASCSKGNNDLKQLGERICEDEVLDLRHIYGTFQTEIEFPEIARNRMAARLKTLSSTVPAVESVGIQKLFRDAQEKVLDRCNQFVSDVKKLSHLLLDEEQERELEQELEEERQKERPGPATPLKHNLSQELLRFIDTPTSTLTPGLGWCVPVTKAFDNTKIWEFVQENCWGKNIFATGDFCSVVKVTTKDGVGEYIRPVNWIISKTAGELTVLLLISPYEANEVLPRFRKRGLHSPGKSAVVRLHMFGARLHPDHPTLWNKPQLTLPPSTEEFNLQTYQLLNANLLIFSGSLFFFDAEEQDTYCQLTGFVPNPRTEQEKQAFENRWIEHGFVLPRFRKVLGEKYCISEFHQSPEKLIQEIVKCRHESFPTNSHVSKILIESKKVEF